MGLFTVDVSAMELWPMLECKVVRYTSCTTLTLCHSLPIWFCNYSIFNDKSEILTVASWISQEGIHPDVQRVRDPLWLLSGLWWLLWSHLGGQWGNPFLVFDIYKTVCSTGYILITYWSYWIYCKWNMIEKEAIKLNFLSTWIFKIYEMHVLVNI